MCGGSSRLVCEEKGSRLVGEKCCTWNKVKPQKGPKKQKGEDGEKKKEPVPLMDFACVHSGNSQKINAIALGQLQGTVEHFRVEQLCFGK